MTTVPSTSDVISFQSVHYSFSVLLNTNEGIDLFALNRFIRLGDPSKVSQALIIDLLSQEAILKHDITKVQTDFGQYEWTQEIVMNLSEKLKRANLSLRIIASRLFPEFKATHYSERVIADDRKIATITFTQENPLTHAAPFELKFPLMKEILSACKYT